MTDASLPQLLSVAEAAADAAASLLREEFMRMQSSAGHDLAVRWKGTPHDPVTACDLAAQKCITDMITRSFPTHRILAEEEGADKYGDSQSPYLWVVDPLDGTNNFIRGKDSFGTIVAVMKGDELLTGCMVLPMRGERFTAAKGQGAFANGQPVRLRKTVGMKDAILCSNITRRACPDASGVLRVNMPDCTSMENYGCAARAIGDVLLGWNDGVFFRGLRLWDIAAGFLMLTEAGGRCRYEWEESGNPRGGVSCVGATPAIFDDLCSFVFEHKLA
ncbi:MAG: inositol monophosphatase [Candidatus Peribacteraceae bacterium]|nr:inositol monophosphatase [Candidatus Peribacteraceae bacterium]MDD5075203.1 inositol monophosphatase [Candidatus Peribacteraceae bacterium]